MKKLIFLLAFIPCFLQAQDRDFLLRNGVTATGKLYDSAAIKAAMDLKAPIASPTFTGTVGGVTASMVGLGNVTNESKSTMFNNATFTGTFATAAGAIGNASLANGAVANLSGTNTGDQTTVSGNAGTATTLETTRTIWGQNFNGSANVTGDIALSTANIAMSGSLAATGARVTKGWFTDIESTNMPTVGGTALLTSLTAPQFTTIELGHATQNTLSASAGVLSVEGVVIPSVSSTNTFTNKRITARTGTTTSSATPTINTDNVDKYSLTAQTVDITSFTTNLSGTPTEGQRLLICITGTASRAITWGASFAASLIALPTTTSGTSMLCSQFVWDGAAWRITGYY